ncbi:MAG TPA: Na+/H+ antiporter subunit C [Bacteroidales bacterium]|nr:Na+/H+ antiporter subunit C [Bacteroidales bacterium]
MNILLALLIGVLFGAAIYMVLRRSIIKLIIGLMLLSYSANLLIFSVARVQRAKAPLIPEDSTGLMQSVADPLPQALVLTAIVIGFGVMAFTIVLIQQLFQQAGIEDSDELKTTDH